MPSTRELINEFGPNSYTTVQDCTVSFSQHISSYFIHKNTEPYI